MTLSRRAFDLLSRDAESPALRVPWLCAPGLASGFPSTGRDETAERPGSREAALSSSPSWSPGLRVSGVDTALLRSPRGPVWAGGPGAGDR